MAVKEIVLTRDEMIFAGGVGVTRRVDARLNHRTARDWLDGVADPWQAEVLGAMAELAVAKWRGREWIPLYDDPADHPDVGERGEVRATTYANGHLIVRERDKPERPYMLVTCRLPAFRIVGWKWGYEAMETRYWRKKEDSWWVPQSDLRPAVA